jgi:DnaK suppressor protein
MELDKHKIKLEEEKKLLEEELGELGVKDKSGDWEATPESQMSNQEVQDEGDIYGKAEDYEERSSKLNLLEQRLIDINKALEKINYHSFGVCEGCQKEIEMDRLEANPAARTCKECMEKIT